MHETIQAHFQELEEAVQNTSILADRKEVLAGSVQRLAALYTKFRQTDESRYFDEITRVIQGVLNELEACPDAQKLDAAFREKLRLLHEELGLPRFGAPVAAPAPGLKKTRKESSRLPNPAQAGRRPGRCHRGTGPPRLPRVRRGPRSATPDVWRRAGGLREHRGQPHSAHHSHPKISAPPSDFACHSSQPPCLIDFRTPMLVL